MYRWNELQGVAGLQGYVVSRRFIDKLHRYVAGHGLDMVDAWLLLHKRSAGSRTRVDSPSTAITPRLTCSGIRRWRFANRTSWRGRSYVRMSATTFNSIRSSSSTTPVSRPTASGVPPRGDGRAAPEGDDAAGGGHGCEGDRDGGRRRRRGGERRRRRRECPDGISRGGGVHPGGAPSTSPSPRRTKRTRRTRRTGRRPRPNRHLCTRRRWSSPRRTSRRRTSSGRRTRRNPRTRRGPRGAPPRTPPRRRCTSDVMTRTRRCARGGYVVSGEWTRSPVPGVPRRGRRRGFLPRAACLPRGRARALVEFAHELSGLDPPPRREPRFVRLPRYPQDRRSVESAPARRGPTNLGTRRRRRRDETPIASNGRPARARAMPPPSPLRARRPPTILNPRLQMFVHRVVPPGRVHPRERLARRVGFARYRAARISREQSRGNARAPLASLRAIERRFARHRGSFAREELELERQRSSSASDETRNASLAARAREARAFADSSSGNDAETSTLRRRRDAEHSLRPRRGRPRTRRDAGRCRGRVRDVSGGFRWIIPNWSKILSQAPRRRKIGADPNAIRSLGGGAVAGAVEANRRAATVDASFADAGRVRARIVRIAVAKPAAARPGECSRKPASSASLRLRSLRLFRGDAGHASRRRVQGASRPCFAGVPAGVRFLAAVAGRARSRRAKAWCLNPAMSPRAARGDGAGGARRRRDGDADADAGRAEAGRRRVASRDAFGGALGGVEGAVRSASGAGARRWSAIVSSKEAPTLHRASATALSLARSRSSARARSVRGLSRERSIRRGRRGRREPARVGTMATARAWVATVASTLAEQRSRVRE